MKGIKRILHLLGIRLNFAQYSVSFSAIVRRGDLRNYFHASAINLFVLVHLRATPVLIWTP